MMTLRSAGEVLDAVAHGSAGFDGTVEEMLEDLDRQALVVAGSHDVYPEDEEEAAEIWRGADGDDRRHEAAYHAAGWGKVRFMEDAVMDISLDEPMMCGGGW